MCVVVVVVGARGGGGAGWFVMAAAAAAAVGVGMYSLLSSNRSSLVSVCYLAV